MFSVWRHRDHRWLAWLAALAVLLGALAPTVSRWLNATGTPVPLALLEVCVTRDGGASTIMMRGPALRAAIADDTGQTGGQSGGHLAGMDHCPFCLLQGEGHGMAPPPSLHAALPAMRLDDGVPALFLHAPRPLHAWATAPARAPPFLSA